MPAPIVLAHISQRGGNAALRRYRVAACREDLSDAGCFQAFFSHAKRGAKPCAAGTDDYNIIGVVDNFV